MLIKHFPKSQFLGFHIKLFVTLKLLEREWKESAHQFIISTNYHLSFSWDS